MMDSNTSSWSSTATSPTFEPLPAEASIFHLTEGVELRQKSGSS
jgi:hypothetical protein